MNIMEEKVNDFFKPYKKQQFKKGEILIRADDVPSGIFYLTDGIIKVYSISAKGEEVIVNTFKPGAFFPLSWAVAEINNKYYFEAINAVTVYKAPKEPVIEFLKQNPEVLYDLLQRVYRGVEGVLTRLSHGLGSDAYTRLSSEIVMLAKRFGKTLPDGSVEFTTTEKELAAQSGLTRETVSREIKRLKEKEIITFSHQVLNLKNVTLLEKELFI